MAHRIQATRERAPRPIRRLRASYPPTPAPRWATPAAGTPFGRRPKFPPGERAAAPPRLARAPPNDTALLDDREGSGIAGPVSADASGSPISRSNSA